MQEITLPIAFIGGLLSFFSPCIIPLIPAYISYLSGVSLKSLKKEGFNFEVFLHTTLFCLGFTIVFVLLGSVLGGLGNAFPRLVLAKVGGVLIIVFGLFTIGLLKLPFLNRDYKIKTQNLPKATYLTSLLIGFAFGIGWTPCVSAILASLLVLAATEGSVVMGSYLLFAFSMGLVFPFMMAGIFTGIFARFISKFQKTFRVVNVLAGILLIALGIMVYTQTFAMVAAWII